MSNMSIASTGGITVFSWVDTLRKAFGKGAGLRALVSFVVVLVAWQVGSSSQKWLGFRIPFIGAVPSPVAVVESWIALLPQPDYWMSWLLSFKRVLQGFGAALIVGIPLGLMMAVSRTFRNIFFPVFEVLRPIPPLAWVPASIIFWPTQEMSIAFVIFLGAFFTILLNVVQGAQNIDVRYFQVAKSMGASQFNVFRRIILPGTLPSIFVAMEVGLGITWEVVVAAEMIAGGSSNGGAGGGLGFFIWNSYIGGSYPQIVVGMISIGIAGYLSCSLVRRLEKFVTPWLAVR